ncbi:MAG: alpha/beta hydrolase [Burkholderiales bacterium]|nr:alpha/beta hydrolase [Burkholderiales bacterium]
MTSSNDRYVRSARGEPRVRRFVEQRWLIDNVIRANGVDWDQPRTMYLNAACGIEGNADFAAIRQRVQKYADLSPAFEATARRREAKARDAEDKGWLASARDHWFMAAIHWGAAQWPCHDNDDTNIAFNQKKRDCYSAYARLADHRVEEAWIPFKGKHLPGWLHLPPGYSGGKVPVVVEIPGMDGFKEISVSLHGDRWLSRGFAVLAVDGPGQNECPLYGIHVSMENWIAAGPAIADWLVARPELDANRICVTGRSFGSLFGTIVTANEPRVKACAVVMTCLEPGCHTIFEEASPTFKKRFMWMAGYTDEAEFDGFRLSLTWEGHAERIRVPYLCVAGEAEELSPLEHTDRMFSAMRCPRQLLVYQESKHSVGFVPSTNLGPFPYTYMADWMADRLGGKPFPSERWLIESSGNVRRTSLDQRC